MEYNTSRGDLEYREYGRTINKVIDNVCNYPDGEKKNTATRAIVYMMAQVAGISVKDDLSYHKLWDHLMILSEFRLQQAWPFTPQELQQLKERIASGDQHQHGRLTYSNNKITTRYYGANLEKMLHKIKEMPNGEEYDAAATLLSQQAKRSYLVWNGELADDNIIVEQIGRISDDVRIKEKLLNTPINVPHSTLPIEPLQTKKKRKKK